MLRYFKKKKKIKVIYLNQVYGGYGKIEVGYSFDSLRDLSGSPTEYIDIKKNFG